MEGLLVSVSGAALGLLIGIGLSLIQQHLGIIKIHGAFVMDAYPVDLRWMDVLLIFFTVLGIGIVTSLVPLYQIRDKYLRVRVSQG